MRLKSPRNISLFAIGLVILLCGFQIAFSEPITKKGEVKAVLIIRGDNTPFDNQLLSLLPVEEKGGEMVMTFTFDHESYTDNKGRLYFKDVPPGMYILHSNTISRFTDEEGVTILIKVQGGDTIDLGKIFIDQP